MILSSKTINLPFAQFPCPLHSFRHEIASSFANNSGVNTLSVLFVTLDDAKTVEEIMVLFLVSVNVLSVSTSGGNGWLI